jgi:Glycosyl transferases group 1
VKILFICSKEFDYAQDLAYSGLVKILGRHNVVDYPWNIKYHFPLKAYPKNLGYSGASVRLPLSNFNSFDLVILGSTKPDALQQYAKILSAIKNKPVVFIDGGDDEATGGDFYRLKAGNVFEQVIQQKPFDLILKREYIPALHESAGNIFPFPFSFPYNIHIKTQTEQAKKYQVAFWGRQWPPVREQALKLLAGKYDCDKNGTILNQDFSTYKRKGTFYLEELAACKIVLNFRGGGWDTMRYWEAPASGSFMISQRPQISIPNNFEEGKHVVWCDDSLNDLVEKIDYYLQRPDERERLAANAKAHLETFHLNTKRAEFIMEKARGIV